MVYHNFTKSEIHFLCRAQDIKIPHHLQAKEVEFYKKCFYGPMTISIDDYVLIANADSADPESLKYCDIGRIIHLYELLNENNIKDPCRAIIQWYSRPKNIPHKFYDNDEISINFETEIIEDHRPYDNDISIECIFSKCIIIMGNKNNESESLLKNFKQINVQSRTTNMPIYVCRYKFIKMGRGYKLLSLNENGEEISNRINKTPKREVKDSIEFIDINKMNDIISPLKSSNIQNSPQYKSSESLAKKIEAARRNLNKSLNDEVANSTAGSDILNYSIINDNSPGKNEMKIKLKLSANQNIERRRSTRISVDSELKENFQRKRYSISEEQITTPNKKLKEKSSLTNENTPRRKSILKTPGESSRKTPRRSILLSNIVEERIIETNSTISTPIRASRRKSTNKEIKYFTNDDLIYEVNDEKNDTNIDCYPSTPKRNSRHETQKKKLTTRNQIDECETETPKRKSAIKVRETKIEKTPQSKPLKKSTSNNSEIKTPTQKIKLLRSGLLTPTLKNRDRSSPKSIQTNLQIAREKLHVSSIPDSLPCRENEFENIFSFLHSKISDECGGCMYVSGVPGTGKTATTSGVIRYLKQMVIEEEIPEFDFIEINGMKLTEPRQAYVQIYKQLTGKTVSWEQAHSLLEKRFSTAAPRRTTTVILVDELDILCNRRQDVVYNLLDWPSKPVAKLVVITIANTMDLPERLLMGKVTSRLGLTRLTFQPYTHKQLQEIVTTRLKGSEAFNGDAVQLVARKVAAVSGDARRALDICRRATEIANECEKDIVNMIDVQQALQEMIASAKVQAIKNCSCLEQLFLQAVASEVSRTGVEETIFSGVYSQLEAISAFKGLTLPSPGNALKICAKLSSIRLLICEHSRTDIFQKILLNVSSDDIHYALDVNIE